MSGTGALLPNVRLFPGVQKQLVCVLTHDNITIESKRWLQLNNICNQSDSNFDIHNYSKFYLCILRG